MKWSKKYNQTRIWSDMPERTEFKIQQEDRFEPPEKIYETSIRFQVYIERQYYLKTYNQNQMVNMNLHCKQKVFYVLTIKYFTIEGLICLLSNCFITLNV